MVARFSEFVVKSFEMRSFWAGRAATFVDASSSAIVGELARRVSLEHAGNEVQQIQAWATQTELLKIAILSLGHIVRDWGVLVELPLLRLSRRVDTIILVRDHIVCLEFKIGAATFQSSDVDQAVDYALCLRDFHAGSRNRLITPVLCADQAPITDLPVRSRYVEDVDSCVCINGGQIADVLRRIHEQSTGSQIDWRVFDASSYNPTPTIVTAARGLFAGHTVKEIGRSDADAGQIDTASSKLSEIANTTRQRQRHAICFVTGEPGSGKTLLGLNLVFTGESGHVAGEPAALLSGNRPLVHVLQEAIARDAQDRLGIKVKEAKRQAQQALQTLLGYLKEHLSETALPPEHVIVFDEAQRAWNAEVGAQVMDRARSEPQLFLEILGRLSWACLVCLVGPGQEINRGEGGLALWGDALAELRGKWTVYASRAAFVGTNGVSGLLDRADSGRFSIIEDDRLHLRSNLRAYRNASHGRWVEALLAGELKYAAEIARSMPRPPAVVTRDLAALRAWLQDRRRGDHRAGLLTSSGAVRLVADGIPPSLRSNELDRISHWFLRPTGDYRSSNALETPLSEFACQGLEIDYAGVLWGNDLIWNVQDDSIKEHGEWVPREMKAPKWQIRRRVETRQYRLNAYRVLLTRARAGLGIFVPRGQTTDATLDPVEFDRISDALLMSGCEPLAEPT